MPKWMSQTLLESRTLESESLVDEVHMVLLKRVGLPELDV
jgi:hypothetical protein